MANKKLTKKEVISAFRDAYKGMIPRGDDIMRREEWNNYTDMLCKDGLISLSQYEKWSQPFLQTGA